MEDIELSVAQPRSPHSLDQESAPGAVHTAGENTGSKRDSITVQVNVAHGAQLESSDAPSGAVSAATPASRRLARLRYATLCWTLFLAGWNDGTTGPLLPRMQTVYHVGFALVSLVFVSNCLGFISAAAANVWLTDRLGFGKVSSVIQLLSYVLEAPAPPFPVFVIGYYLNGFGIALQEAGANSYVASLKENTSSKFGILHAIYGVGACAAPLVATQFAQLNHWSFHYLVSMGIAFANCLFLLAMFQLKDRDTCLTEIGQAPASTREGETDGQSGNKFKQMFRLRTLHILAFFILIYVGVEVTLGGWIVQYVIDLRGGGPSSGYIASAFFGGLTLGRVGLLWVNRKLGEHRAIFLYAIVAIGLELVVWLVPSLIGGGIAVSFVGVLLGPMYPVVMNYAGRVLPPWLLTGCIGWIAGFGQAGSAFLPFLTGAVASKAGIKSLQPLLVSMMALMVGLWALVPSSRQAE
ncbi:MFS general substrate transporter [Trametes cingulata]|nr:MFS general substrate transporter [Trametes cingulata]